MTEMTLTSEAIDDMLTREIAENGHRPKFVLQVSRAVHDNLQERGKTFPCPVLVVEGWHPDLMGSAWSEP